MIVRMEKPEYIWIGEVDSRFMADDICDKTLREFKPGDILRVMVNVRGFSHFYLCEFVAIEKGVVVAHPKALIKLGQRDDTHRVSNILRVRAKKCHLHGKRAGDTWSICQWFSSLDSKAGEKA